MKKLPSSLSHYTEPKLKFAAVENTDSGPIPFTGSLPHGWTIKQAEHAYETYSTGCESGRSFEGFIAFEKAGAR